MQNTISFVSDTLTNIASELLSSFENKVPETINKYVILPGFCDVHVHFREPGFSYKETIKTGTLAAARGGYTAVCTMPNLNPVPDCEKNLRKQLEIIERDAAVRVFPYGALTEEEKGEKPAILNETANMVIAFSDDGKGIQNEKLMRELMIKAKSLGKIVAAHCEDNSLIKGGCIHECNYSRKHHYKWICSESEWKPIERDLRLAKETGCAYHICHISTKESVDLVRKAKHDGVNVTCETAPHYLTLTSNDLQEDGCYKMNPPLRDEEDRFALIKGIKDGTIDMIATDHAPHSAEEKNKGLEKSAFGIVGLETTFPILYTRLVKTKIITFEKLLDLLTTAPRKRFSIPEDKSFSVWEIANPYKINPDEFLSKGKSTPFRNETVYGKNLFLWLNGNIIYK